MKQGRPIESLVSEIERRRDSKRDFLSPTDAIEVQVLEPEVLEPDTQPRRKVVLDLNDKGRFDVLPWCHSQIASRTGVPMKYYNRMLDEAPHLLADNINHWFHANPEVRLVRTLDQRSRAFLSDRYRPLENDDLFDAVMPPIMRAGCQIASCEVTDTRFYLKAVLMETTKEVTVGDPVRIGVTVMNSEVGRGALKILPFLERLVCTNGMVINDHGLTRYHIGKVADTVEKVQKWIRDDTRRAQDEAFFKEVRDVVHGVLQDEVFERIVEDLRQADRREITGDVQEVVEVAGDRFALTKSERSSVLRELIKEGKLSQYGLAQAVSRVSQEDEIDYDRATDLEMTAHKVIELPSRDWSKIAEAA